MVALPTPVEPLTDGVVLLRRFNLEDVPAVTEACQDPEIPRWTASIPAPYEEHHARTWIALHDRFWVEDQRATFAFCDASAGDLLGCMTLGEIDFAGRSATAGYWAAPWARNRGATTRALRLVCRWGFASLGLERVGLSTLVGNVASERVAEKAGFLLIGNQDDYRPLHAIDPEARYRVKHWMLRGSENERPVGSVELEVTDRPKSEDVAALSDGLDEFNRTVPVAADATKVPLAVFVRQEGVVVGGAYGDTHHGWLYLGLLWVAASFRGAGWGRRLVERFESEGVDRGCRRVWVDTYGFQAPGFYQRLGYREFGRLEDFPPGSARHFLWKTLGD